jgi:hypothetical protein
MDDMNVPPVMPVEVPDRRVRDEPERKDRRRNREQRQKAKDCFKNLAHAAERAHVVLSKGGSPYRFCVYRDGEEIFIDIVILDENGEAQSLVQKNITHDEFLTWIRHIEEGRGLLLDAVG